MKRHMCNEMLKDIPFQWAGAHGWGKRLCPLKGCRCEGPSCMAWAPLVAFCRDLCPRRAECGGRLSDLVGTLDRPASDFDEFGFCLVHFGEALQKRRTRRAALRRVPA